MGLPAEGRARVDNSRCGEQGRGVDALVGHNAVAAVARRRRRARCTEHGESCACACASGLSITRQLAGCRRPQQARALPSPPAQLEQVCAWALATTAPVGCPAHTAYPRMDILADLGVELSRERVVDSALLLQPVLRRALAGARTLHRRRAAANTGRVSGCGGRHPAPALAALVAIARNLRRGGCVSGALGASAAVKRLAGLAGTPR